MAARQPLKVIERQLTLEQVSQLWLERVRRFSDPSEYVVWFFDKEASSTARKVFLSQAGAVMRRRDRSTPLRSDGNRSRVEDLREICSPWIDFWLANGPSVLPEIKTQGVLFLIQRWCVFVHLWGAAAKANREQANAWLKQQEVRAVFLNSLLCEGGHGVKSPPIVDHLVDAGVGGRQDESWPHRPPWLDAESTGIIMFAKTWAKIVASVASFQPKVTPRMLFPALAERVNLLQGIYTTLVSWANHAAGIGLLPLTCAIEPDPTKLSLSARRRLKMIKPKAAPEARSSTSESEAGTQFASPNTIARMLLDKKKLEMTSGEQNGREDDLLLFPNVTERLIARAERLRSDIRGLPPWKGRNVAHVLFTTFSILEKELIRAHRIPQQAGHTYLDQWYTSFNESSAINVVEYQVSAYREFVPGGGTATDKELVDLGLDGITDAVKKHQLQKLKELKDTVNEILNQREVTPKRERTPKRSALLL